MKIAVAGKGGSGKTVVSGTVARALATTDADVVAIDDDPDPNLAVSLGLPREDEVPPVPAEYLAQVETDEDGQSWELTCPPREIIDDHGIDATDGVTLLRAGEVAAGDGSFGYSHVTVFNVLSEIEEESEEVILLDMAAGLGAAGMSKAVDVLLLVVEPTLNSLETIRKLNGFATEYDVPDVRVVANNVRTDRDIDLIEDYCADHDLEVSIVIPNDDAIRHAEQEGTAPIDYTDGSPAVRALRDLADDLRATHMDRPAREESPSG